MLDLWFERPLGALDVLITLHRECLACASLAIGKNCPVVTVYNLFDHSLDSELLVELPLVCLPIEHFVKAKGLRWLISRIELERDCIVACVEHHLTTGIVLIAVFQD